MMIKASKPEWKISNSPVAYPEALAFMEARVAAIAKGEAAELIWLLEHPPLYTAGTSARPEDLLEARFPVFTSGRGGQYTYHGPGQRIAYVMLNLKNRRPDLRDYVWRLEEWGIEVLAALGIAAERRAGRVGLWVVHPAADGRAPSEEKIAAVGVRVRRWVSYHGIAFNLSPDISHFSGIVPCGIRGYGVTSLAALGCEISYEDFDQLLEEKFSAAFL